MERLFKYLHHDGKVLDLIKSFSRFWLKIVVGMFLVIAVNSLVVCGINFNINVLLIPWQIFYIIGKE